MIEHRYILEPYKGMKTETGLQIAEGLGVAERTFKYFLNVKELFTRISRGEYQKLI